MPQPIYACPDSGVPLPSGRYRSVAFPSAPMTPPSPTPEERLLLELCRRQPRGDVAAEASAASGVDAFPALSALAMRHGVHGLVLSRLRELRNRGVSLPGTDAEIDETLAILRRQAAFWDMEQDRVLAGLARAGFHPLVLKGGALRRGTFSPVERVMGDLDILVERSEVDPVLDALTGLGYRSEYPEHARAEFRQHHQHDRVAHPRGFLVEVHWQLTRPQDAIRLDPAGFQARAVTLEPPGAPPLRVPATEDTLIHTVSQIEQESVRGLRRLVDLDRLAAEPELDWALVTREAREAGLHGFLCVSLRLAHVLLGTEAPAPLLDGRALPPRARGLISAFGPVGRVLDEPGRGAVVDRHLFRLWGARTDHRKRAFRERITGRGDSLHWVWAGEEGPEDAAPEPSSGLGFGLKLLVLQTILDWKRITRRVPDFWTLEY